MTPEQWETVKALFEAALERPPDDRVTFVAAAAGDADVRREVQSLLAAHHDDGFLDEAGGLRAAIASVGADAAFVDGMHVGPYEVLGRLGTGGMGEVFKARDTRLDRLVAIKMIVPLSAHDPVRRERFRREAQAIAGLSHPHICTLHDVGEQDGVDFLVMELLEGRTLAERLEDGPLPVREALGHAIQIAAALDRAHRDGIVHRDLKPANVMVTKDGVKLLDFGIAKLRATQPSIAAGAAPALTGEGVILGTLSYMAPEQVEGKDVDARTDIFAFGAILHEMLTGKRAFDGGSQASIIGAVLHTDPPAVSTLQPGAPAALERVVSRCLAKNPDDRWQTARDLLAELKWIADTFETAAVRAVAVPTASTIGWRRVLLPALLLAVAAAGLLWWRILPLGSHARPVVILMDSRLPERIYDPETRRNGGTNADDISDDLRDLDLEIHKETTSGAWHREDQVLEQNSSLIVMHLSSFADSQTESAEPHLSRDAQEKLRAFLGYIGMGNASTKFLIYTRRAPDAMDYAKWIAETETRFPALKGRVTIMFVPGGDEATFRDPATARDIGRRVKSMVTTR